MGNGAGAISTVVYPYIYTDLTRQIIYKKVVHPISIARFHLTKDHFRQNGENVTHVQLQHHLFIVSARMSIKYTVQAIEPNKYVWPSTGFSIHMK